MASVEHREREQDGHMFMVYNCAQLFWKLFLHASEHRGP